MTDSVRKALRFTVLVAAALFAAAAPAQVPNLVAVRSGPLLIPATPMTPAPDDVTFYDPAAGTQIARFPARSANPSTNNAVLFTPDRTRAIVTGGTGADSVQVFDVTGALPVQIATLGLPMPPADVDVTPNGRFVIVRTGAPRNPFAPTTAVVFLNPATGGVVATFPAGSNGATTRGPNMIAITPDSSRAVVTGGVGPDAIQVFDLTPAVPVRLATYALTHSPYDVDVAPNGSLAVVRSGPAIPPMTPPPPANDNVTFLNPATGALVSQLGATSDNPRSSNAISFTPDSARVVVTGGAGADAIRVFNLTGPTPALVAATPLSQAPGDVDVSPDGKFFVVRSGPSSPASGPAVADAVAFVNPVTGAATFQPAASNNAQHSSNSIAFKPDSTRAVVTGGSGQDAVQIFDLTVAVPVLLATFPLTTPADDVHVAPNGRLAVVRSGTPPFPASGAAVNDAIAFYAPATATQVAVFPAPSGNPWDVNSIAILPDSSRAVVTGGAGAGAVRIFDLTAAPAAPTQIASIFLTHSAYDVNDIASPEDLHQPDAEDQSQPGHDDLIEVDHFADGAAAVELQGPFGVKRVRLNGAATVNVSIGPDGEAQDSDGNGLDDVQTEMVQLDFTGTDPDLGALTLSLRDPAKPPFQRSFGEIEEAANQQPGRLDVPPFAPSGTAASFFDIFFELRVAGPMGNFVLHNENAKRMQAVINHKPPDGGTIYGNRERTPLADENRNPAGVQVNQAAHLAVCRKVPPFCGDPVRIPNGIQVPVQAADNGLFTIEVTELTNATINPPISFPLGSQSPLTVTALKNDPNTWSRLALKITDLCGNVTLCDPAVTVGVRDQGRAESQTIGDLPQSEGKITVFNGTPGLKTLRIDVNGTKFMLTALRDGEQRTLDVSSAMRPGNGNAITLTTLGKPGGSAEIMIHD
ncbi:MAG TPA: hypothetical protein VIA62_23815 [Thermoanaerobaculia bacterium]|nr:hypothetical protein [Thermoanaerobaculia bacterium]